MLHITAIQGQFVGNLLIRQIQSHEVQTQYPHFQRLMMSGKNSVRQIIKASVTVMTLITLTGGFGIIKALLDDLYGHTRGTRDALWPAELADGLITLHIIDETLDIDLRTVGLLSGTMEWDADSVHHPQIPRPWNPI